MFHLGRFITVAIDTEADQVNIKALYFELEATSSRIDVSILVFPHCPFSAWIWPSLFVGTSQSFQLDHVRVKRMTEIQPFEDELKEVNRFNSVLSTWNQELEAQLAEVNQARNGNIPPTFYFCN
jgi:hypothetical protein